MAPGRLTGGAARQAYDLAAAALNPDLEERPLGIDLERAADLLPRLATL
jgi:histidine ammonia-lyase